MEVDILVSLTSKKLLLLSLVEEVLSKILIKDISGINKCHIILEKSIFKIQTEGVNVFAAWNFNFIDHDTLEINDIHQVKINYGVKLATNNPI